MSAALPPREIEDTEHLAARQAGDGCAVGSGGRSTIRLVVADDHAIVRAGLRQVLALASDMAVVGEVECGADLLDFLRTHGVDLVLLDLNMPGLSGADLITHIRGQWPHLPLLVFTLHHEPSLAARVLKAGANGYITKDSNLEVLLPAIRKVAAHGHFIAPGMAEKIVFHATPTPDRALHLRLTGRETEVLGLLTAGVGVGDIAEKLHISGKTVSTHKVRLMAKMGVTSMADLMRYALQHDLLG